MSLDECLGRLRSLMIAPIQRIPRYELTLRDLMRYKEKLGEDITELQVGHAQLQDDTKQPGPPVIQRVLEYLTRYGIR